ncbi:hypothetical protein [Salsuginibacillus kocurii]|uniref:hypothetical protein n=1 Tax=Salsuginibacillus kocurii TaxID=427078 RepID=UPI00035CE7D8|nr:hypothetical protein [Salsuginibacillus kocurii]
MAAYLLLPYRFLQDVYVSSSANPVLISEIADEFLVSEAMAHRRLELAFGHHVDAIVATDKFMGTIEYLE